MSSIPLLCAFSLLSQFLSSMAHNQRPVADPGGIYPPHHTFGLQSVDLLIMISLLGNIIPYSKYNFDLSHINN